MKVQEKFVDQLAISIAEFVQLVPWGRSKTYQLINSGELKVHKVGRSTVLLPADVTDFFERLRSGRSQP